MTMHDEDESFAEARRIEHEKIINANARACFHLYAENDALRAENAALFSELARTSVELTEVKKST